MKRQFYCILVFCILVSSSMEANWQRPITNYTRHIYNAGTQNWSIQQQANGWIYVANNKGLLEFDGVEWNIYPVHNAKLRAVKVADDGCIYVGGMRQFGFFTPNNLGGLNYTCLSDSISPNINVGVIWNILQDKDRIYFQSDHRFFYLQNGKLGKIDFKSEIHTAFIMGNKFYVFSSDNIFVLNGDEFIPLSFSIEESQTIGKVTSLLPYEDKILIVTRSNGLFLYDGISISKFETPSEAFCKKNQIFCAALQDSILALGSVQDGICLLNLNTGLVEIISTVNGLQNKTVLGMMFDKTGNLWLGLDNGIDCIQLNAQIASLYGGKSVIGAGYASCCYHGKLYLGTNQGLYSTLFPKQVNGREPMNFVPGTGGQMWSLFPYDDKLFCCSDNGVFIIDGTQMEHLNKIRGVWKIVSVSTNKDVLLAGTYSGLYLLIKKGKRWELGPHISNFQGSCKDMLLERGMNTLWVANKEDGVFRLKLSNDLLTVEERKSYNSKIFPKGYDACLAFLNNEIVIASHYGIWYYNHARDSLEKYGELENMLGGDAPYSYLRVDSFRNIWYVSEGALNMLYYDAAQKVYNRFDNTFFMKDFMIENFENVSLYNPEQAIIGTEEGFSLLKLEKLNPNCRPLSLQVRKVFLTEYRDSLIYGRSYQYNNSPIVIPYSHNSLRIQYSATNYDTSRPSLYSYKLQGFGQEDVWSDYGESNMKEFTGLREGKYVFSVKLMVREDQTPMVTSFSFEILPPWYRTWWSYMIYVSMVILIVFYIYYRIVASRKRLLMQQELELYRQQQEFKKESDLKDYKMNLLKEENLQSELRHKSEELIRTTLNIVRKNEMLMDIKKEVVGISHSISEENLVSLRRKTLRLLGKIETNIEHDDDLQAFQSTFDSVHHDFFKRLEEAYPELNNKEKMLCAYIKMNLLSKEIAPLLNISVRGVEISRYRLRKKLNLEERDNLAEFLQKFAK